jgi:hypothetical protein
MMTIISLLGVLLGLASGTVAGFLSSPAASLASLIVIVTGMAAMLEDNRPKCRKRR